MSDINYTITSEEVKRDSDNNIMMIKTEHRRGGLFTVKFIVDNGEATITRFTPIGLDEKPLKGTQKIKIFEKHTVQVAYIEYVQTLLATACQYVDENYDVDVQRALWLDSGKAASEKVSV